MTIKIPIVKKRTKAFKFVTDLGLFVRTLIGHQHTGAINPIVTTVSRKHGGNQRVLITE
jgi:hypothetical protein